MKELNIWKSIREDPIFLLERARFYDQSPSKCGDGWYQDPGLVVISNNAI